MGKVSDPLVTRNDETPGDHQAAAILDVDIIDLKQGWAWKLIQAFLMFIPRAFNAQQCFVTIFTDSVSYPSNIISEWSLENASLFLTSLPSSSFFLGSIAGGFLLLPLADTCLGRKNLLFLSCLIMSLSGLFTCFFATNLFLYSVFRFLDGFGRASIGTSTLVLATEIVGPNLRAHVGIMGFVFFSFGFLSLPAIAYLSRNSSWRLIYLWTSLPALLYTPIIYFFVRESPRWLSIRRGDTTTTTTSMYSSMRLLVSRKWALNRLVLVMVITLGLGVAYYGMPLGLGSLSFNLYVSVAMEALMELLAALLALCLIGKVNRKPLVLLTATASGIFSIACGAVSGSSWTQVVLELAAFLCGAIALDVALTYISELFPTCVRNSALAMVRQAVMIGAGIGVVLAAQDSELLAYGGFGVVILVCGLFVVCLPETKGTELSDTMDQEECKYTVGLQV